VIRSRIRAAPDALEEPDVLGVQDLRRPLPRLMQGAPALLGVTVGIVPEPDSGLYSGGDFFGRRKLHRRLLKDTFDAGAGRGVRRTGRAPGAGKPYLFALANRSTRPSCRPVRREPDIRQQFSSSGHRPPSSDPGGTFDTKAAR
jgi:hypothetical protein